MQRSRQRMIAGVLVVSTVLVGCSDDGSADRPADSTVTIESPPSTAAPAAPSTAATAPPTSSAPIADVAGFLDAVASSESDIGGGSGIDFITDPVGKGRYDASFRQRQESIDACASIERPLLHGATYAESIDGRGWLYVDLDSPQRPYIGHSVLILADEAAAQDVIDDLRGASGLADCIATWIADVNGDDAGNRNAPWASATIEYSAVDVGMGEPLDELGDDQITVVWQQHLSVDGVEAPTEEMMFSIARIGPVLFTFSGNDPDRTAATAAVLAARTRAALP